MVRVESGAGYVSEGSTVAADHHDKRRVTRSFSQRKVSFAASPQQANLEHQHCSSVSLTLAELLTREGRSRNQKKSCLKTRFHTKKQVRFATNPSDKIWCLVKKQELSEELCPDALWWTEYEMRVMFERFIKSRLVSISSKNAESELKELRAAYKSCRKLQSAPQETLELCHYVASMCLDSETLKSQVFSKVHEYRRKHCVAVLSVQEKLRKGQVSLSDGTSLEKIQLKSLKFSKPSQMIAQQMAQVDSEGRMNSN